MQDVLVILNAEFPRIKQHSRKRKEEEEGKKKTKKKKKERRRRRRRRRKEEDEEEEDYSPQQIGIKFKGETSNTLHYERR